MWSIVNGTKTRPIRKGKEQEPEEPSGSDEDQVKWQEQDDQAKAVIMFSVMVDDLTTVTDAATAHEGWQALKDLYDCETVNTTINLLKNILERTLSEGASLPDHLTGFHYDWIWLKDRSQQGR